MTGISRQSFGGRLTGMTGSLRLVPVLDLDVTRYPEGLKVSSASELLVPISDLVGPELLKLLIKLEVIEKLEIAPASIPTANPKSFGLLVGGFILEVTGTPKLVPGCCGDLSNLGDWARAATEREKVWQELWIGHPSAVVRRREGRLELASVEEGGDPPEAADFSVDAAELSMAIENARREIAAFRERLIPVLQEMGFKSPKITASSILGEKG